MNHSVRSGTVRITGKTLTSALSLALCLLMSTVHAAQSETVPDTITQRVAACFACHGKQGVGTSDGFYPRIAGKPAGYLYNQLINFRQGRRSDLFMMYMVDHQSDAYLKEIAEYFSDQHPPYAAPQKISAPESTIERGRVLVTLGDASKHIPACVACHGQTLSGRAPAIPGLVGLPKDYLNAQLGSWKNGARHAAAPDCMAQIASRLNDADINAAVAWLTAQQVTVPAPTTDTLPMSCGSVPQ
jgi:cytochrome c553